MHQLDLAGALSNPQAPHLLPHSLKPTGADRAAGTALHELPTLRTACCARCPLDAACAACGALRMLQATVSCSLRPLAALPGWAKQAVAAPAEPYCESPAAAQGSRRLSLHQIPRWRGCRQLQGDASAGQPLCRPATAAARHSTAQRWAWPCVRAC